MIRVTVLVENSSLSPELSSEHGLSLHIETKKQNILFDMGAGSLFLENADKLGIKIADVDKAFVSHGHYDHGGGLSAFLKANDKAPVYISKYAFGSYLSKHNDKEKYVGLDNAQLPNERIIFIEGGKVIDEELESFSVTEQNIFPPSCNSNLFMRENGDGALVHDDFKHEQNLIVRDGESSLLLSGCAHNGIVNILERCVSLYRSLPTHVIGGFHLYSHSHKKSEDPGVVFEIGRYLLDTTAEFYTGHCTGEEAYGILSRTMGQMLKKISTGSRIEIY